MRDYFAARAMQALIAKLPMFDERAEHGVKPVEGTDIIQRDVADAAYAYADAMLRRRRLRPAI